MKSQGNSWEKTFGGSLTTAQTVGCIHKCFPLFAPPPPLPIILNIVVLEDINPEGNVSAVLAAENFS